MTSPKNEMTNERRHPTIASISLQYGKAPMRNSRELDRVATA
jgi:hypothetical protein